MDFGPNRICPSFGLDPVRVGLSCGGRAGKPVRIEPVQVDQDLRNSGWTQAMEAGFMKRPCRRRTTATTGGTATFFENEKRSYALAMLSSWPGTTNPHQVPRAKDNPGTGAPIPKASISMPALPSSTRCKYFYFGDRLDPAYKARMKRGAKIWTESR